MSHQNVFFDETIPASQTQLKSLMSYHLVSDYNNWFEDKNSIDIVAIRGEAIFI